MELFNNGTLENILPGDGVVIYYGKVITTQEAQYYLDILMNSIAWENDEVVMFGKPIITKRKMAWYGDKSFAYTYSKTTRHALPWITELLELKEIADKICDTTFNSCLLNLYHDGDEGMSWHSDDENTLEKNSPIASFSFGAERKFSLKHRKNGDKVSLLLENGSLLEMKGTTQTHWLHSLPKSKKIRNPRVNLTFRRMKKSE